MRIPNSKLWSLATVIAAALVAWGVAELTTNHGHSHAHPVGSGHDSLHDWLHDNLDISSEQEKVLLPIELAYEEDARQCKLEIQEAGRALAEAIRNYPEQSDEIEAARLRLHEAKGRLEEATLVHFFAMKKHLTAEQGEKLLEWTHESLLHGLEH